MDEPAIRDKYLDLFSIPWDSPSIVPPLEELRKEAESAGQAVWVQLIDALLLRAQRRFADGLAIIEIALASDPNNPHALFLKAALLAEDPNRRPEAVASYDTLVAGLSPKSDLPSRRIVAMALSNNGLTLARMDKPLEALGTYDELLRRFGNCVEPPLREQVAKSLIGKGAMLEKLERPPDELAAYDEVVRRFDTSPELPLREQVAKALFGRGLALHQMLDPQDALGAYDAVIRRFAASPELPLREQVANALINKGIALAEVNRPHDEMAAYDEVIRLFGNCPELPLRERVARALLRKGEVLELMGRLHDALRAYGEVNSRYADDPEPSLRNMTARALFVLGKVHFRIGNRDEAIADLNAVIARADAPRWILEQASLVLQPTRGSDQPDKTARVVADLPVEIDAATRQSFKDALLAGRDRKSYFFHWLSRFRPEESFLLVLREWNSFTPAIPDEGEAARGGGYFIRHKGTGIVIDPGFDFLEIFHEAGGRLCDIDHIVITHAHNDHTADLEPILTLLYEFNEKHDGSASRQKKVTLYLSQGAARKLSGIIQLRGCNYLSEVVTLNRGRSNKPQTIQISAGIALTVLPAYHDDILTADYSVGLGFQFDFPNGQRRLLFTGDTAVLPATKEVPQTPIHATYPIPFCEPGAADLVVAHIGSIESFELDGPLGTLAGPERTYVPPQSPQSFYDKHLGLRGTFLVFYALRPRAGLVSEFGEEMKSIWIQAVGAIGRNLNDVVSEPVPVFAGDPIIVYDIAKQQFLCHEDQQFHDPADLSTVSAHQLSPDGRSGPVRPYLFQSNRHATADIEDRIKDFHRTLREHRLPHFTQPPAT
jgi:tetratricopeptide (TPR) repeat protein